MKHFPLYIDISHKNILVIGGGRIAERRIATLLSFGPTITLLSPNASELLQSYAAEEKLNWVQDSFPNDSYRILKNNTSTSSVDFKKFDIILAVTNKREINQAIYQLAKKEAIPVNVCDCQSECDFFFPAIIESTHAVASVTANGSNHTLVSRLAASIRTLLQELDQ